MTILLWWTVVSVGVSLFVGAFLSYGHRDDETLNLNLDFDTIDAPTESLTSTG